MFSYSNKKQEAYGPRLTHLRDIATADMQMLCNIFSNPFIATNKKIIWAVLSFEEAYMGLTVNGVWSFEQTINHISTVGSMWNLMEIG